MEITTFLGKEKGEEMSQNFNTLMACGDIVLFEKQLSSCLNTEGGLRKGMLTWTMGKYGGEIRIEKNAPDTFYGAIFSNMSPKIFFYKKRLLFFGGLGLGDKCNQQFVFYDGGGGGGRHTQSHTSTHQNSPELNDHTFPALIQCWSHQLNVKARMETQRNKRMKILIKKCRCISLTHFFLLFFKCHNLLISIRFNRMSYRNTKVQLSFFRLATAAKNISCGCNWIQRGYKRKGKTDNFFAKSYSF